MSYFEEYECGCVSKNVGDRTRLLGHCPKHHTVWRRVFQNTRAGALMLEVVAPKVVVSKPPTGAEGGRDG